MLLVQEMGICSKIIAVRALVMLRMKLPGKADIGSAKKYAQRQSIIPSRHQAVFLNVLPIIMEIKGQHYVKLAKKIFVKNAQEHQEKCVINVKKEQSLIVMGLAKVYFISHCSEYSYPL